MYTHKPAQKLYSNKYVGVEGEIKLCAAHARSFVLRQCVRSGYEFQLENYVNLVKPSLSHIQRLNVSILYSVCLTKPTDSINITRAILKETNHKQIWYEGGSNTKNKSLTEREKK